MLIIFSIFLIISVIFKIKSIKKQAQQEEHRKIKEYGENINDQTRNKQDD